MSIRKKGILLLINCFLLMILLTAVLGWKCLYNVTLGIKEEEGFAILRSVETTIDKEKYINLSKTKDADDPYYKEMVEKFNIIRERNDLRYLYTESYEGNIKDTFYVLDGYSDDSPEEDKTTPGLMINSEDEIVDNEEMIAALTEGKETCARENYTETWGNLMSCYIPIKDSSGNIIGAIGADFSTENIAMECRKLLMQIEGIIIGTCLFTLAIIYFLLNRHITKPIDSIVKNLKYIKNNDFTKSINKSICGRKDEIGIIAVSIEEMRKSISNITAKITNNTLTINESVNSTIKDIEILNDEIKSINHNVQNVSGSMEETTATTEEINATSNMVKNTMEIVKQNLMNGKEKTNLIADKSADVKKMAGQSRKDTSNVYGEVQEKLNDSLKKVKIIEHIKESTNTILDISDQTNLLALNASIEAARAGEHGKGFSIVASEIGALAERSKEVTKNMQEITDSILNSVDELTYNSLRVLEFIETKVSKDYDFFLENSDEYKNDCSNIQSVFGEINLSTDELYECIKMINKSIEGITCASNETTSDMLKIAQNTESISDKTNRIIEKITNTKEICDELNDLVKNIRT